ncbi:DNA/RNA non-specific endonuclease [Arundinibacter roseus]|uniref:Endonuclease n=1 Tax=Arundinibacter roseus TaxID=2070510 RepID=A0A4R4KCE7_9BACT|nr:DNA/RNA non-specific endonuclease [Arundinibacter roseus]TDB64462.1 DNA/RNA non-specific endonuclease [Arundinibacter roseus]
MTHYKRRGFRLPNNTLLLLIVFFTVGLFLHYGGKTKPVLTFWGNLKDSILGENTTVPNPYKVPEPFEDTLAVDDGTAAAPNKEQIPLPTEQKKPQLKTEEPVSIEELTRIANQRDFFLPAIGSNDQLVRRVGYTLKYVEKYEQAAWVAYVLQDEQIVGGEERENEFMPDPVVKSGTAITTDYTKSGFDRGHLAPAADFKNSYQVMKETFYMSNISPQHPQFNRGIWLELEKMVRIWAVKYKKVYVVTGPVLKNGLPTIGRINKVAVPEQFYKVILYVNPPYVKGIAFLMKNEPSQQELSTFVVSIDQIEKLTGIDFFPRLPDAIESKIEAKSKPGEWFRLK